MQVSRVDTGESVVSLDQAAELWRDGNEFIRPKWGIYRQSEHALIRPGDLNDARIFGANIGVNLAHERRFGAEVGRFGRIDRCIKTTIDRAR